MLFLYSLFLSAPSPKVNCENAGFNCLQCVDNGCAYCPEQAICLELNSTTPCQLNYTKRVQACVNELGGDARPIFRYVLGGSVLLVSIAIDLSVRCLVNRK